MKTALSIAGSDSCGGAGIQADIKTMTMNGVYAMSAITALTAQNTTGVRAIQESTPEFLKQQIDAVFEDIRPDAVKIGMVSSSELIRVIADRLKYYAAKNVVVDPVMVATSGSALMKTDAVQTLIDELFPIAALITPNIPEAQIISGLTISSKDDMLVAAEKISKAHGCAVLLKGGHSINDANDLLYADGQAHWFEGKRIDNPNTHGTGCTLSSAIAANLAKGFSLSESVRRAKDYISGALSAMLDLGAGSGPMNHAFDLQGEFAKEKNMKTTDRLIAATADIWKKYNEHPFVMGLQNGTLDKAKFRYYIIQDYLYLVEYAKTYAVGVAKSKDLDIAKMLAKSISVMNGELNVHSGYMGKFGVTQAELDATPRALDNLSYTSYMLRIAYDEGEAEVMTAVWACSYSYEVIAKQIVANRLESVDDPFYGEWIRDYASDEYAAGNVVLFENLNRMTKDYNEKQLKHLEDIAIACSRYELMFWEMAWNMSK